MGDRFRNAYPADWPEIARAVKDEAAWKCIRCGHPHDGERNYILAANAYER